jgi:hypothetical protein
LRLGDDGGLIVHCFGGCAARDVYAELRWRGLCDDREREPHYEVKPARSAPCVNDKLRRALAIWAEAVDAHGTLAEAYLAARLLELPYGADVLRYHGSCPFGTVRRPCMVALFRDTLSDEPCGIQRTALPPYGWVRGMKMERLNLGPTGIGSIKLDEDVAVTYGLTIAEGTETALAGRKIGFAPAWATGGKGTLGRFPVLPVVETLSIHWELDADANARKCAGRWVEAGRGVELLKSRFGKDMADALWEAPT